MTGHVKTVNLSGNQLARLARFKQMAEQQLLNLGGAIREARELKGISRSELGLAIHVAEKTVERWEKGKAGAMENLTPIAEALDTKPDALLAAAAAKSRKAAGVKPPAGDTDQLSRIETALEELVEGQAELDAKLDALLAFQGRDPRHGAGGR